MINSRRTFLIGSISTLALCGCKTVVAGTTKTHVVDVAKIVGYATAGINGALTVATVLSFIPQLEMYIPAVKSLGESIREDLARFNTAVGGSLEVSFDNTNIKTIVSSIALNLDRLTFAIEVVLANESPEDLAKFADVIKQITLTRDALLTVAAILNVLIGTKPIGPVTVSALNEQRALFILNVV